MPVAPIIPTLPPAPQRSEAGSVFADKADAHIAALVQWTAKANELGTYVNTAGSAIDTAVAAADSSKSAAQTHAGNAYASSNLANTAAAAAQAAAGFPPTAQFGQVLHTEGQTNVISTATQLQTGHAYECDTSAVAFNVTLPLNPNIGDFVWLNDHAGKFARNNLTVLRNGQKIRGQADDYIMDLNNLNSVLVYISAAQGWAIK